jgi:uncharacterized protein YecT (DUF1311 family)
MRLAILSLLLVLSPASPTATADCANATDQTTLNECADAAFKKSDAELNALYKKIEQRLKDNDEARKLLVGAQRAWLTFRDADCGFSASRVAGGSLHPMTYATCLDDLTQRRTKDFEGYLTCEEGDTSCPVPAQ